MGNRRSSPAIVEPPQVSRLRSVRPLGAERSGRASLAHARHQLYVARDKETRADVLLKVAAKPGLVYEQNLANEAATLSRINSALADSRHFPLLIESGRLSDGRLFLIMSLFDEWPLATSIGPERRPDRLVSHVRTAIAVGEALAELHGIGVYHIDLNPMNVLHRSEQGRPVIRIIDFESAYDVERHGRGAFYNPPTTSGFTAPEMPARAPDCRADVYSLGAVLYTMIAGYEWTWSGDLPARVAADTGLDAELKNILLTAVDLDREKRFSSVPNLQAALISYLHSIWSGRVWSE